MTSAWRILVVMVAVAASAASAGSAAKKRDIVTSAQISAPFDVAWAAVIRVFAERSWPIKVMEKASGLVATDAMTVPQDLAALADCGSSGLDIDQSMTLTINVFLTTDGTITVNTKFTRQRQSTIDKSTRTVECFSTGVVEEAIISAASRAAASSTAQPSILDAGVESSDAAQ